MAPSRAILSTAPSQAARASSELRWGFNLKSKSTKKYQKKVLKNAKKVLKKVFKGNSSLTGSQSLCPQLTWLRFWEFFLRALAFLTLSVTEENFPFGKFQRNYRFELVLLRMVNEKKNLLHDDRVSSFDVSFLFPSMFFWLNFPLKR